MGQLLQLLHMHVMWLTSVYTFIATCKLEDAVKDAKVVLDSDNEKETYVEDEQVVLKCDLTMGYQLAGDVNSPIVRVCLSNLTWSGMDPNCTRSKLLIMQQLKCTHLNHTRTHTDAY